MSRIHASHLPQARHALWVAGGALCVLLALRLVLPALSAQGVGGFPLALHTALETLAVVIAGLIFAVVWSSRRQGLPRGLMWLACAFLGVAVLDFSHLMSYAGMPDYFTPGDVEKGIWFWLAARTLGVSSLLALAWLPWRARRGRLSFAAVLLGLAVLLVALHALIFTQASHLPATFVHGAGLTTLKIAYEYGLMALYILAAVGFWHHLRQPRSFDASGFFVATALLAQSEYFFTLYVEVVDLTNLAGHVYKVAAFAFLYRAVFAEMVARPYGLLRASQARLKATLEAMPDLVFELDAQGRYRQVHASRPQELSAPVEQLLGRSLEQAMPIAQARIARQALDEARERGLSRGRIIALETLAGMTQWFELSVLHRPAGATTSEGYTVISRDVTERRQSQQALRKWAMAVEQSTAAILIMDARMRIEYVNQSFCRSSGYMAQEVLGRHPRFLYSGKNSPALDDNVREVLARGAPWSGEVISVRKNGEEYTESVLVYPVHDEMGNVSHYLAIREDITERKQSAERIHQLANYDQLTGLPNRNQLHRHFAYLVRHVNQMALLWVDLDHFKQVNDALGHSTGDLLLLEMSLRLRAGLGMQDVLSRLSGDDFVVLLPGRDHAAAATIAQELLGALSEPLELAGQTLSVSASIGVALYPADADQAETLLQRGETAMYRAKADGRGGVRFYQPEMHEHASRTLALGNALKSALSKGELYLEYQPQVSFEGERVTGAEALLRWRSEQWGYVVPSEFIPIAESNGILPTIEEWVLRTALEQRRRWMDAGLAPLCVAVNISAGQFERADLPELVARLLDETGVPPELLELELTEAIAMRNPVLAARQIGELSRRRIRISIDDFGTGYSSLSSLKRFMINTIKIDQSFVRDLHMNADDQAITRAIINMAQSLGMRTIAEGVETAQQLGVLSRFGCDAIQGYYVSRSLSPAAFEAFVRSWEGIALRA